MIEEEFIAWHSKHSNYVQKVTTLMSVPLNDEPEILIRQAEEIEAHNAHIGFLLADAERFLDRSILDKRPLKQAGMTEGDRVAFVNSEVSAIRAVRDKLEYLCDAIKQRLILSESLLAYHRQFHDRDIRGKNAGN